MNKIDKLYEDLRASKDFNQFDDIVSKIKGEQLKEEVKKRSEGLKAIPKKGNKSDTSPEDQSIISLINQLQTQNMRGVQLIIATAKIYSNAMLISYKSHLKVEE